MTAVVPDHSNNPCMAGLGPGQDDDLSDTGVAPHHEPVADEGEEDDEAGDAFNVDSTAGGGNSRPLFDLALINQERAAAGPNGRGSQSVATTADIASDVGSVMMLPKEAFMKSFTFFKEDDINWGISFGTPVTGKRGLFAKKLRLPVAYVDEDSMFGLSRIREGDYLKSINGQTVGPSLCHPDRALEKMKDCLERDGYLQVTTKNKEEGSDDILVHATIVKPRPDMTLEQLGMKVWVWGYLCIKEISPDSVFKHTALRPTDNIISINEIVCEMVDVKQVGHIIKELPREVTVTVLRRKQRNSGNFN